MPRTIKFTASWVMSCSPRSLTAAASRLQATTPRNAAWARIAGNEPACWPSHIPSVPELDFKGPHSLQRDAERKQERSVPLASLRPARVLTGLYSVEGSPAMSENSRIFPTGRRSICRRPRGTSEWVPLLSITCQIDLHFPAGRGSLLPGSWDPKSAMVSERRKGCAGRRSAIAAGQRSRVAHAQGFRSTHAWQYDDLRLGAYRHRL